MIFDTLDNAARYDGLGYNLPAALRFLQQTDLAALPVGRTEIDGQNLFALVQEYTTKTPEQGLWEAHRRYIDIQMLLSGTERMGFAHLKSMQLGDYVPEKDFQPMTGSGSVIEVTAGSFLIFFPEDAHMPGLCVQAPEPVRKIVLKVSLEH